MSVILIELLIRLIHALQIYAHLDFIDI